MTESTNRAHEWDARRGDARAPVGGFRRCLATLVLVAVASAGCGQATSPVGASSQPTPFAQVATSAVAAATGATAGSPSAPGGASSGGQAGPSSSPGVPASDGVAPSAGPGASPAAAAPPVLSQATLRVVKTGLRLPIAVSRAVAFPDGISILVCGGLNSAGATTGRIVRIDLAGHAVSTAGRLAVAVHDAGGAIVGTSALIFGGGASVPGSVVQRIGIGGPSSVVGRLPAPRADLAVVWVVGEALVVGGGTAGIPDRRVLATTDGRHFRVVATLRTGVRYPAVAALGGIVYVVGGAGRYGDIRDIQAIDAATGLTRIVARMPLSLSHAAALVIGGRLVIAGGRHGGHAQSAIWSIDPGTGVVTRIGTLPRATSDAAAVVVGGVGYLIGGEGDRPLDSIVGLSFR